jgi:hypothetical protein
VIAVMMALQLAVAAPPAPLAELPPQQLETGRCALFLWDRASGTRIAMLGNAPPQLRAVIDGRLTDLPQDSASGTAVLGFAPTARYRSASRQYDVAVTILPTSAGGGVVRDGSLTITEADGSARVIPVAGILGCS